MSRRAQSQKLTAAPDAFEEPAGIYIHIPFCRSKCPYCSFVSYPGRAGTFKSNYLKTLARQAGEMAAHPWSRARKFRSLFVGGGNPPTVGTDQLSDLIGACLAGFAFTAGSDAVTEVTLEANPESVTLEMLQRFREAGVNRLSLGLQAFSDTMLKNIGRNHTVQDNIRAFKLGRAAGFDNINLDLMYGLPGQDTGEWENCLNQVVALSPEHLAVYELTIEKNTPFGQLARGGRLHLPPEDEICAMFVRARESLATAGYNHYEISNYGRPGYACSHNVNYWENGGYIGLGAGAVSCFSGVRIKNEENAERFIEMLNRGQAPFAEAEFLSLEARFRETVVMGLRMTAGVSVSRLKKQFDLIPQQYYGETLDKLSEQDLLTAADDRLRLTQKGQLLANRVMAQLV